jgi:hypothetical protein
VRDAWWIIDGATRVRVDSFERARDGACERAGVTSALAIERDRHGDATWFEAGRVLLVRDDAYRAWVWRTGQDAPSPAAWSGTLAEFRALDLGEVRS